MTSRFKKIKTKKSKLQRLSDEDLYAKATVELINFIRDYRDGKVSDTAGIGKYNNEAKRRGITFRVNPNLIHRVCSGEFDHADGVAVGVTKAEG